MDQPNQTRDSNPKFTDVTGTTTKGSQIVVHVPSDINLLGQTVNHRSGTGFFVGRQDATKYIAATTTHLADPQRVTIKTIDGKLSKATDQVVPYTQCGLSFGTK